jgi:hypothetical protein
VYLPSHVDWEHDVCHCSHCIWMKYGGIPFSE